MARAFLITVVARVAAGLILQDGGATPPVDLAQALRARQYLLTSTPVGDRVPPINLLTANFDNGESDLELLGESADSIAQAASLDNAGFGSVAATKSTAAMATFVRRLLDSQNLRVKDEAFMVSVLPYYTGECANQSFSVLTQELYRARKSRSCHPAWVVKKDGNGRLADKNYMTPFTAKDIERGAVLLVRGVMAELGATVKSGNFQQTWEFATRLIANNRNVTNLQDQLRHPRFKNWIRFEMPMSVPTFAGDGPFSSWLSAIGSAAPLNEDGYRAVLYTRNEDEMSSFIRRVAKHEGLKIVNDGALAGMTPYYSGLCARQSYDALVRELHSLIGQSFAMNFDFEISSNELPSVADLQAIIAERAGVDVSHVKIEDTNARKLSRQLDRRERRQNHEPVHMDRMEQRALQQESSPGTNGKNSPVLVAENGHGTAKHKGYHVTISIDSAPQVHDIKKSLKAAAFLPGSARVTLPKALELQSSKLAQCGGGLLLPK